MSYEKIIADNREWIDDTFAKLDKKLSVTAVKSRDKIPYTTKNGVHDSRTEGKDILWWTNGFWGGMMWMMYQETGEERCIAHPVHPHGWSASAVTEYAADMNILLAYQNLMDDWRDEHSYMSRAEAAVFAGR